MSIEEKLSESKHYKIRLASKTPSIWGDPVYSDKWELFERVMDNDVLKVKQFVFKHPNNKNKLYFRHHFTCPANGNSLLVLGQFRDPEDFAYVFIVLHPKYYDEPYIVIERFPMITHSVDSLAEMVRQAFNWVLRDSGVEVILEAKEGEDHDLYLIDFWRSYNLQLYKNGGRNLKKCGYEDSSEHENKKETEKEGTKTSKKSIKSDNIYDYISKNVQNPESILIWLDNELRGKKAPMDIMRPIRLLIDKHILSRPTFAAIDNRYNIKGFLCMSTFNYYTNKLQDRFRYDDVYKDMAIHFNHVMQNT